MYSIIHEIHAFRIGRFRYGKHRHDDFMSCCSTIPPLRINEAISIKIAYIIFPRFDAMLDLCDLGE